MTFDLGTVPTYANPFVSSEIEEIASFRLGLTRVQQQVRSEWHIQDGGQLLSKTVPFLPAIAHKPEVQQPNLNRLDQFSQRSVSFYF